eukprot:497101-Pelagomonas_calceolata.AAC.1
MARGIQPPPPTHYNLVGLAVGGKAAKRFAPEHSCSSLSWCTGDVGTCRHMDVQMRFMGAGDGSTAAWGRCCS